MGRHQANGIVLRREASIQRAIYPKATVPELGFPVPALGLTSSVVASGANGGGGIAQGHSSSPRPKQHGPETYGADGSTDSATVVMDAACAQIRADLIGRLHPVETPFGSRPLVYADWTASGRPVESIEHFMHQEVLPRYGNTHTTTSATGAQTTAYREEARRIIAETVNAKAEDAVLFVGSGTTGAVAKIVAALSLDKKSHSWNLYKTNRPVVFLGPFEHHSNILPWKESHADVVTIKEDAAGGLDLNDLQKKLKIFSRRRLKIGSFAAASNLTGALEDVDGITRLLHQHEALSFWDYATAAPYVPVDMNPDAATPQEKALLAKDAVFMSGHKFLGGAGTPGLLVGKRRLFGNKTPVVPAGGTVLFVMADDQAYLSATEEREEGGTPDILGSIRLGLVFQMKQRLGSVQEREEELTELGLSTLRSHPRIVLVGDTGRKRLPIFSFLVRHGDRFLHHNFVCALLNDLFGIQARAGCQCAGPYHMKLLGVAPSMVPSLKRQLFDNVGLIKPGSCRFSLAFFISDAEARYILNAVMFVADHGASFLPLYEANVETAEWSHKSLAAGSSIKQRAISMKELGDANFGFADATPDAHADQLAEPLCSPDGEPDMFNEVTAEASRLASEARQADTPSSSLSERGPSVAPWACAVERGAPLRPGFSRWMINETLRWFVFEKEDEPANESHGTRTSRRPLSLVTPKVYNHEQEENSNASGKSTITICAALPQWLQPSRRMQKSVPQRQSSVATCTCSPPPY